MDTEYGSYTWAAAHAGQPSPAELWAETSRGLWALARTRAQAMLARAGLGPRAFRLLVSELPQPRSPLVAAAEARLVSVPAHLRAHSYRTYAFGAMLGLRDGLRFDAEALLLASLLHDVGLAQPAGAACFAQRGAEDARVVLEAAGARAALVDEVMDAITRHLDVTPSGSVESQLLRRGAGFDVVADGFFLLHREARRDVVSRWPREDFAASVTRDLEGEATRHPGTRVAFLCHRLDFPALIQVAERRFARDRVAAGSVESEAELRG
jgi:hypothetical protein